MKFLLGTYAYNRHVQNIALSLHEAGILGACYAAGVDNYRPAPATALRRFLERTAPGMDRQLKRRRITTIPNEMVHADWLWEIPRTLASKFGADDRIQDWFWERGERRLDARCARLLSEADFQGFWGIEHGALSAMHIARRLGKKNVVAFLSPHHATRERLVDREYYCFPELFDSSVRKLQELGALRDARRDEEAALADVIHTNSSFTAESLISAGFPRDKMLIVPLGSPPVISEDMLPVSLPKPIRFIYAGPISVRKGAHYLLDAWRKLACGRNAELHFYGIPLLPRECFANCPDNVVFHGSVSQGQLFAAYEQSAMLIFPTLCDGFGIVVSEAMAHGLPVVTTFNCGAADLIEDGQNGFCLPAGDVQRLVECMDWCIRHPEEVFHMRRPAWRTAQNWTWQDFRRELRDQLSNVLGLRLNVPSESAYQTIT
jgi:glycosyltransferase involved in cell wall biosynthesis